MQRNSQTKDNLEVTRQQQKETARNYNVIFQGILRQLDYSEIEGGCPLQKCQFRSNPRAKGEYQNTT